MKNRIYIAWLFFLMVYWNSYSAFSYKYGGFNAFLVSQIFLVIGFIIGVLLTKDSNSELLCNFNKTTIEDKN